MLDLKCMLGKLDNQRPRLTAIGIVLCLLAAIFAFEAKVAWYSPAGSPSAQISSAKLQPAEAPKQLAQTIAAPAPLQLFFPEASLLVAAALSLAAPVPSRAFVRERLPIPAAFFFSPSLFRRPPPQY